MKRIKFFNFIIAYSFNQAWFGYKRGNGSIKQLIYCNKDRKFPVRIG